MSEPFPLQPSMPSDQPVARRRPGLLASFRHAYEGLIVACGQRNMKLHVVSAVLVCLVGSGIKLGLAEKVSLIFCVMLMFFAEILNTALEALVDLHTEDYRQLAKTTKDAAAASVLVLAMGTVIVFAAICVTEWETIANSLPQIIRQATYGLPLAAAVAFLLSPVVRARAVDHAMFVGGAALWGQLWGWTVSYVFTALAGCLLWLAWRVAARRPVS